MCEIDQCIQRECAVARLKDELGLPFGRKRGIKS